MKLKTLFTAALAVAGLYATYFGENASATPVDSMYPAAATNSNPACYMESGNGSTLDLSRICGSRGNRDVSGSVASSGSSALTSSESTNSSSFPSYSGSGNCYSPDDIVSDGSRCGRRAANIQLGTERATVSNPTLGSRRTVQFRGTTRR